MKKILVFIVFYLLVTVEAGAKSRFITAQGINLIQPNGEKLFIKGTNLGNWLNPEGYMFGFSKTSSPHFIDEMFKQMVGPTATAKFWKAFLANYITEDDIKYIKSQGANTIRLPFNYKLFSDEDYMGITAYQNGFMILDNVISWCRKAGLYLILDMHDCPGGQTGDNIDDGYGYPWLFTDANSQKQFCDIWKSIAKRYKDEPTVLGYEPMNEPIAPYFISDGLNDSLIVVYKKVIKAIREVDHNHLVLIGGAQWNGNFKPVTDLKFDDKLMLTCHRYGGASDKSAIQQLLSFRDSVNLPMYMGETGHNDYEWMTAFVSMMKANNMGYTFWPYKKIGESSFVGIKKPAYWQKIIDFAEADRSSYTKIREARPNQDSARTALMEYVENSQLVNCIPENKYIKCLQMK